MILIPTGITTVLVISFIWNVFASDEAELNETDCQNKYGQYCPGTNHTMCQYTGVGEECTNPGSSGVTPGEIKEILDAHNEHRSFVAAGNETRGEPGPQPPAANMRKLSWDNELALLAQRWADQCRGLTDDCRNVARGNVGQARAIQKKVWNQTLNWTEVVDGWYNEVKWFPNTYVASYNWYWSGFYYPQIVWGLTYLVGCGKRKFETDNTNVSNATSFVCNYFPAGLIQHKPVYINGTACTKCPPPTICENNLCVCPTKPGTKGFWDKVRDFINGWYRWFMGWFWSDYSASDCS